MGICSFLEHPIYPSQIFFIHKLYFGDGGLALQPVEKLLVPHVYLNVPDPVSVKEILYEEDPEVSDLVLSHFPQGFPLVLLDSPGDKFKFDLLLPDLEGNP